MTLVEHSWTEHFDVCYLECSYINSCVVCCNMCVCCIMLKYIVLVDRCIARASPGERYT